jgi:DNA-binding response OmpR family regulator
MLQKGMDIKMIDKKSVLVVDDEPKICEVVKSYLENSGYEVFVAFTGNEALAQFEEKNPSLIILDLMLPDMSGEQICAVIRKKSNIPIMMLTAKVQEENIVNGLNIGADDYVTKPFSPKQLVARVNALLRRTGDEKISSFNNKELKVDLETREVLKNGESVSLTPIEFNILKSLIKNPKRVFTRDELINNALNERFDGFDRVIDSHIKNLRKKIEEDHKNPKYILTIYGLGYKFGGE